uniref:Tc1-like transposase DDE domain-containing protein n=1 Tax=Paramormyrops kingsleyae TaxID=1676925 RepID=A0A3B3T9J5_9TELE
PLMCPHLLIDIFKIHVSMDCLCYPGVPRLEWPALSPDLNPIETLWDQLSRRVEARNSVPQNLNDLRAAFQVEWDAVLQQTISRLMNSMRRCCQAVMTLTFFVVIYSPPLAFVSINL